MPKAIQAAFARARFRRQPAPVRFAFADRIDGLNPEHWDELTADRGLLLQRGYFRELERALPPNLEPRYAMLYRADSPLAALAMQLVRIDGGRLRRRPEAGDRSSLASRLTSRLAARVLVVGNLLSYGNHGIAIRHGCEADADTWHGIGEAAYRVRRAEKHGGSADFTVVKDLDGELLQHSALLRQLGYRPLATEPNMVLALQPEWRAHADYLAALSSKYRKNVRARVLEPIAAAGLAVQRLDDVAAAAPRLQELYLAVHEGAALRPVTLDAAYWPALARAAGDRARFATLVQGQRLVGFLVTLLADDATALGYHIGFDREVAATLPLYLRLLHCGIADGIELGARRLSLGRTALEPKAALGAAPEPLHVWVRHRRPLLNKLLRALLSHVHHAEPPARNPFAAAPV